MIDLFDIIVDWVKEKWVKDKKWSFGYFRTGLSYLGVIYYTIVWCFYVHYDYVIVGDQILYASDPQFFNKLEKWLNEHHVPISNN